MKIGVFSLPFRGHINVLLYMIQKYSCYEFDLVILGWNNIKLDKDCLETLMKLPNKVNIIEYYCQSDLAETDPILWSFPRMIELVPKLVPKLVNITNLYDYIIYDFFALEGYIIGKHYNIPTICSIPAFYADYDQSYLDHKLSLIKQDFDIFSKEYPYIVWDQIELVSDGLLVNGDYNLLWSYEDISRDLTQRKGNNIYYQINDEKNTKSVNISEEKRPSAKSPSAKRPSAKSLPSVQKIIYVSLGTVVMGNLWNNEPGVRKFINLFFDLIYQIFANKPDYLVYISVCGRSDIFLHMDKPTNFIVNEYHNQKEILSGADLFITHGGNNSFNEAIVSQTPMIVIPFFGDQHAVAQAVENNGLGISFPAVCDKEMISNKLDTHSPKDRIITKDDLNNAINHIFENQQYYLDNFYKISRFETDLRCFFENKIPMCNGDLLYGCNQDREAYIKTFDQESIFVFGKYQPFSEIMMNNTILPRIIDIYHDAILSDQTLEKELLCSNQNYSKLLREYHEYLLDICKVIKKDFVKLCTLGIEFFIAKGYTIHFILDTYTPSKNYVTQKELEFIQKYYIASNKVKYYTIIRSHNNIKLLNICHV